jgi:uncharacterized membrane protein YfcA
MEFSWHVLAIAIPFVFVAGFVDSIAGGGGVISVTGFLLSGLPVHNVYGVNKMQAMVGTAVSTRNYIKNGHFNWKYIPFAIVTAIIGSAIGAKLVTMLSDVTLRRMLMVVIPFIAIIMMFNKKITGSIKPHKMTNKKIYLISAIIGLVIGLYDGFIGPGTGTFLIIAFTMCGMKMLDAGGNAKVINLVTNVISGIVFLLNGQVLWWLAIPCIITNVFANYIGSKLAIKNGEKIIRPTLIVVMGLLIVKFIFDIVN